MHDVFEDGRTIFVSGAIDAYMTETRRKLRQLAMTDPRKKIVLVLSTPGGVVYGAFALMDEIALLKAQTGVTIEAVVQGWAMSAGSLILQAADRRLAGPHSQIMVHGSWGAAFGDEDAQSANALHVRVLHERLAGIYAARTEPLGGKTARQWRQLLRRDLPHYYSARQALAEGLIDEVIG